MKRILSIVLVCVCAAAGYAAQEAGKTKFFDDVSLGTWSAMSNITHGFTTGGTYTNGIYTNYYRVCATNAKGRLPVSTNVFFTWTGSATTSNAVSLAWSKKLGAQKYVIMRSRNAGSTWTQYVAVAASSTNWTDTGTNTWSNGNITSMYSVISAPSVPWPAADTGLTNGVLHPSTSNAFWLVGRLLHLSLDTNDLVGVTNGVLHPSTSNAFWRVGNLLHFAVATNYLKNLVEDTSPTLGGNLSLGTWSINGPGDVTGIGTFEGNYIYFSINKVIDLITRALVGDNWAVTNNADAATETMNWRTTMLQITNRVRQSATFAPGAGAGKVASTDGVTNKWITLPGGGDFLADGSVPASGPWNGNQQSSTNWWKLAADYGQFSHILGPAAGVAVILDNPINGNNYVFSNVNIRADSLYVAGGQTNAQPIISLLRASSSNGLPRLEQVNASNVTQTAYLRNFANTTGRVDYLIVPFLVTNQHYEIMWLGPWDETRTIAWHSAKLENSTCTVRLVENVFTNGLWRTFTTNNSIAAGTTGIKDSSIGDATVEIGHMLGVDLEQVSATATGGTTTIKMVY